MLEAEPLVAMAISLYVLGIQREELEGFAMQPIHANVDQRSEIARRCESAASI